MREGDKQALLEYLDSAFGWRQTDQERQRRFRVGIGGTARLAPGVKESLVRIAGQFRLGLISNGTGATQRAKLKALAVEALFDPIVISEEVGLRKTRRPDLRARDSRLACDSWRRPFRRRRPGVGHQRSEGGRNACSAGGTRRRDRIDPATRSVAR